MSQPHVAVCVDKSRSYGRGVLLGIGDFLEKVGPWSLYVDCYAISQLREGWNRRWRGDGILAYIPDLAIAERLMGSKIPVVDVAGTVRVDGLPRVVADDDAIGRLAAEHLRERRFRHFAYVGPGDVLTDDLRHAGFVAGLAGVDCPRYVHPRDSSSLAQWERRQLRLERWLARLPRPVGIMAYSDLQAREVLDACVRAGLSVPLDAAVVGVDNDEEICRLSRIPLSSVASNPRRIGFEAALLISRLMGGEPNGAAPQPTQIAVPPLYVVTRHSSDVTAVDDVHVARALAYIHQHAARGISIDAVARAVGVPRRSLYRRFAEALGRTPHEELQRTRFEHVRRMLAETELSLADVAQLSGFETSAYLCTCFKRAFGMTPGDYRRQHQKPGEPRR